MPKYPVGEIESHGTVTPIFVNEVGRWLATVGEKDLYEASRDDLVKKITSLTKRSVVKVEVPFHKVEVRLWTDDQAVYFRRGVATGIHSGNGNVMIEWPPRASTTNKAPKPIKEQLTGRASGERIFKPLTKEQLTEWRDLVVARAKADKAYRAFIDEHELDLRDAVLKAIEDAKE